LLKLTKLEENDDIEAFLKRAAEAHGVERGTWVAFLAPQLMGTVEATVSETLCSWCCWERIPPSFLIC